MAQRPPLIRSGVVLRAIATAVTFSSLASMTAFAATHVHNTVDVTASKREAGTHQHRHYSSDSETKQVRARRRPVVRSLPSRDIRLTISASLR
jgi:hypothetical protein